MNNLLSYSLDDVFFLFSTPCCQKAQYNLDIICIVLAEF